MVRQVSEIAMMRVLEHQDWGNLPIFHQRLNEVKICRKIWSIQKDFVPLHQRKLNWGKHPNLLNRKDNGKTSALKGLYGILFRLYL